jgi:hypothetical protein
MLEMRVLLIVLAFGLSTGVALAEIAPTPKVKAPRGALTANEALIAKKAEDERSLADCERHWDAGTHMTKHAWRQTCRRVQERFRKLDLH